MIVQDWKEAEQPLPILKEEEINAIITLKYVNSPGIDNVPVDQRRR